MENERPWYTRLFGWPLSVIGSVGVLGTISNMASGHVSRLPAPAGLALAAVVLASGITLLRIKRAGAAPVPHGAELTPSGEISYDRRILEAMRACEGHATAERIASLVGISQEIAERELRILVDEGACRQLENGEYYFREFDDASAKRHLLQMDRR